MANGTRNWMPLLIAALIGMGGGVGGSGVYRQISPPRPYPYTSQDADEDRRKIREEISNALSSASSEQAVEHSRILREVRLMLRELESEIRSDMPPPEYRARMKAVEYAVERLEREAGRQFVPPYDTSQRTEPDGP